MEAKTLRQIARRYCHIEPPLENHRLPNAERQRWRSAFAGDVAAGRKGTYGSEHAGNQQEYDDCHTPCRKEPLGRSIHWTQLPLEQRSYGSTNMPARPFCVPIRGNSNVPLTRAAPFCPNLTSNGDTGSLGALDPPDAAGSAGRKSRPERLWRSRTRLRTFRVPRLFLILHSLHRSSDHFGDRLACRLLTLRA